MNDAARQRICILGSTGSVGVSTLDVLSRHTERYEVVALTAYTRIDELFAQCVQWRPRFAAILATVDLGSIASARAYSLSASSSLSAM